MASVGRPPEVDKHGVVIQKSLVNVTIPTKLANFLKEKGINRSKLFKDIVTKLYNEELCPRCYGENLTATLVGRFCNDCNNKRAETVWLELFNCKNCGNKYQPGYNMFAQSKKLEGCFECIPPEERL